MSSVEYVNACDLEAGMTLFMSRGPLPIASVEPYRDLKGQRDMIAVTFDVPSKMGASFATYEQVKIER